MQPPKTHLVKKRLTRSRQEWLTLLTQAGPQSPKKWVAEYARTPNDCKNLGWTEVIFVIDRRHYTIAEAKMRFGPYFAKRDDCNPQELHRITVKGQEALKLAVEEW